MEHRQVKHAAANLIDLDTLETFQHRREEFFWILLVHIGKKRFEEVPVFESDIPGSETFNK